MLTPVAPQVRIVIGSCQREGAGDRWNLGVEVANDGSKPITLEEAWIPHGRFRGDGRQALSESVAPGASASLEFVVRADEPAGTVVENAFLILRARINDSAWRIFSRMRVEFAEDGAPMPIVESVTSQSLE
jgi:hypothetical protein